MKRIEQIVSEGVASGKVSQREGIAILACVNHASDFLKDIGCSVFTEKYGTITRDTIGELTKDE